MNLKEINNYEEHIRILKEKLFLSEQKFNAISQINNEATGEYNVNNDRIDFKSMPDSFCFPKIIESVSDFSKYSTIIYESSRQGFKNIFSNIKNGLSSSCGTVIMLDSKNTQIVYRIWVQPLYSKNFEFEIALVTVKDISKFAYFENRNKFVTTIASNNILNYTINISKNTIDDYDKSWEAIYGKFKINSFDEYLKLNTMYDIHPKYIEHYINSFSLNSLISEYNDDQKIYSFEYLSINSKLNSPWIKNELIFYTDNYTKDLMAFVQVKDISERKAKEKRLIDEKRYYDAMVSKADQIYEVNFTKNKFISGHENWQNRFGFSSYNKSFEKIIHIFQCKLYILRIWNCS